MLIIPSHGESMSTLSHFQANTDSSRCQMSDVTDVNKLKWHVSADLGEPVFRDELGELHGTVGRRLA